MATIAEIDLPAEEFALHQTLSALDTVEFEVERVVAHDQDHIVPYVWADGVDRATIETALQDDPSVENIELMSDQDDHWLYQMDWVTQIQPLVQMLVEEEAIVLTAFGNNDQWDLRVLFPDREALSRTYEFCADAGLSLDLQRVYDHDDSRAGQYNLTEEQEHALVTAFETGFFEIPRDTTLADLADDLDISHQATRYRFSGQLWLGY